MFFNKTTICVGCNTRVSDYEIKVKSENLGICQYCYSKLIPVKYVTPFSASKSVDYVICGFFYDKMMKKLIHKFKFRREWKIGELLVDMVYENIKGTEAFDGFDFMCAVPLSKRRFFNRGYNQAELLALGLSEKLGIKYDTCIYRSKNTLAQSSLNRVLRIENVKDAFVADKRKVEGKNIIIFDDIYTTGSTLEECAAELIKRGANRVIGLSVARAGRNIY